MNMDVTAVVVAVLAAPGLWNLLTDLVQRLFGKRDVKSTMLLGLAHDRVVYLGLKYIERGYITHDEFENLHDYLYIPYTKLGGNGTAKKVMEDVKKLPMKG